MLKEKLNEGETQGIEHNLSVGKHKVVEGYVLKESINKSANFKNLMHNASHAEPEIEDSKKKLFNCHSFHDLKSKECEKENQSFKFKEPTKDFAFDDKSSSKGNLNLKKPSQSKPSFNMSVSEKDANHETLPQGRSTMEANSLMRDSSHQKMAMLATEKSEKNSPGVVPSR